MAKQKGDGNSSGDGSNGSNSSGNDSNPRPNENTQGWVSRTVKSKGLRTLTIAALVITGFIFLPPFMLKQLGNTLFPFIPEEYRPLATAGLSFGSCCCICCIVSIVAVMMLNK